MRGRGGLPRSARLLISAAVATGVAALATRVPAAARWDSADLLHWGLLTFAAVLLEQVRIPIRHGRETHNFDVSDGVWAAALLLAAPGVPTLGAAVGLMVGQAVQRVPGYKIAFNVGQFSVALTLAEAVHGALATPDPLAPASLLGTGLGMVAYFLVNGTAVVLIVAAAGGRRFLDVARPTLTLNLLQFAGSSALGILAAVLWVIEPVLISPLAVPIVLSYIAFRSMVASIDERDRANARYEATRALTGSIDAPLDPVPFLRLVHETFGAAETRLEAGDVRILLDERGELRDLEEALSAVDGAGTHRSSVGVAEDRRGSLTVSRNEPFSPADRALCDALAAELSLRLDNERLFGQLRSSEARYRELVDAAPDIIYTVEPDGTCSSLNPAFESITGWGRGEWVGRPALELVHPDDRAAGMAMFRQALDGQIPPPRELRLRARSGEYLVCEFTSVPRAHGGAPTGVFGIARDITGRKMAETALRESLEMLDRVDEQRRRLLARLVRAQEEERWRVANDIHDDSVQAMTAALLRLETIARALPDHAQREALAACQDNVRRALSRLRHLLFELRPAALDREGLAAAVQVLLAETSDEAGFSYAVEGTLAEEPPPELRLMLYRIIQEAVANVRKHARARQVDVTLQDRDGGVHVRVSDDGVGFDPTAPSDALPDSLGFAAMRERAEMAGGWFRVDSAPGEGTRVEFWLPALEEPADREVAASS